MSKFGIGEAVKAMHDGHKVRREGWNGKGMWLALQVPDSHSKMSLPYVYMKTADEKIVPWLCSQTDLLATDWELVTVGHAAHAHHVHHHEPEKIIPAGGMSHC